MIQQRGAERVRPLDHTSEFQRGQAGWRFRYGTAIKVIDDLLTMAQIGSVADHEPDRYCALGIVDRGSGLRFGQGRFAGVGGTAVCRARRFGTGCRLLSVLLGRLRVAVAVLQARENRRLGMCGRRHITEMPNASRIDPRVDLGMGDADKCKGAEE